jgi:hypothetical protein
MDKYLDLSGGSIFQVIQQLLTLYIQIIDRIMSNKDTLSQQDYIVLILYTCVFAVVLLILCWVFVFLMRLAAKGVSAIFVFITDSLHDNQSIPYIASLVLVRSVPWYFLLLLLILVFCGIAALLSSSQAWTESFKYILGATVGSLIGVVKKKEDSEFEEKVFQSIGLPDASKVKDTANASKHSMPATLESGKGKE